MRKTEALFHFRLTPIVLRLLGLSGAAATELLRRVQLPVEAAKGACTAPLSHVRALLDEASRIRQDPHFGLTLSRSVPEGTYEAAELLVRTAPDLKAGLTALVEHAGLVNPIGLFRYEVSKAQAELHHLVAGQRDGLGAQMNEYTVAYVLRGLRLVLGMEIAPRAVWFSHSREAHKEGVEAFFGCPAEFGQSTSGLAFNLETTTRPITTRDPVVHDYLKRQASSAGRAPKDAPFSVSVSRAIDGEVGFAAASLQSVASYLAVTERTAQRRLRDEGTQFRDVLDQTRHARSDALLAKGVPDERVAEMLGFADVGTYRRARRRWQRD